MRGIFLVGIMSLSFGFSCTDRDQKGETTLTRRQRDSIIGESSLPGASGVRNALAASDSAAAREARRRAMENDGS